MKKIIEICTIWIFIILFAIQLDGQNSPPRSKYFGPPVDYSITLAGSFAELRATHFHAGIDIKPKSKTGIDTVRAVADGYVSRIKVQKGGYGQALYIDHPNGYTTVYAHLDAYADSIRQFIENIQHKTRSYTLDIYPDSTLFHFSKGEPIGLMGNTGNSFAKHLHFEIRETESEIPVNPALFGLKPKDDRPPVVLSVDVHQITPDYYEHNSKTYYPSKLQDGTYTINGGKIRHPAWQCGISVQSYDLMNGASNRNGVYYQHTYVDDTLYHSFTLDKVSFDETRFINSHVDFNQRYNNNRTLVRTFKLPGNELNVYDSIRNNGLIKIYEKIPREIKIVLGDIEGNESVIKFQITRDGNMLPPGKKDYTHKVKYGIRDTIELDNGQLVFNSQCLDRDLYLNIEPEGTGYLIGEGETKLFSSVEITLPLPDTIIYPSDKTGIWYMSDDQWINLGGQIEGDKIVTYSSGLGKFKLGVDTIPPTINMNKSYKVVRPGSTIGATLQDNMPSGGLASAIHYDVYLDGKWIIAPFKNMTRRLSVKVPKDISPGLHKLHIKVADHHGNTTSRTIEFTTE